MTGTDCVCVWFGCTLCFDLILYIIYSVQDARSLGAIRLPEHIVDAEQLPREETPARQFAVRENVQQESQEDQMVVSW